ncbi:cation:proton antiporter [Hyphobacterium sp. HN65]|uniref:Cation:proton antiporter n=1 Tax=Hyphobacterium lacteum TaxID=3116575 RepID=A0ABU7LQJ1_9PROT|nr:cation:proton antiporter [Hyphobacterium sp. HN65]MEE2526168.1 cation:proton antiporter [Hyphobacterium sp. HN65]
MHFEPALKDFIVFLVAAGIAAPIFRALKQSAVLAFLLAGVLLGPYGLGRLVEAWPLLQFITIGDPHAAEPFAEAGVLFLLFMLGLELSFSRLWALRKDVFGLGAAQVLASAVLIGAAAIALGLSPATALVVALALALSSTAIVMQMLIEEKQATTVTGRTAFAVLLFQDLMVAPILILVGFLALGGGDLLSSIGQAVVGGAIAIAVIGLAGRFLLRPAFQMAAAAGGREMMLAVTLLAVIGASVATASAGLSLALGAFLAGLLMGETEFKAQIEIDLEPFKGLLLGLFFMTVGMSIDPLAVLAQWPLILGGAGALILGKIAIAYVSARLFGHARARALRVAALLGPAGEFAFVVLGAAAVAGVVQPEMAALVTAAAGITMLAAPFIARVGGYLAGQLEPGDEGVKDGVAEAAEGHVIIAGYGRVGQMLGELLAEENAAIIAIDTDPKRVSACRRKGVPIFYGDAGRAETLQKAGIETAAQFIVTVDDPAKAERVVKAVRARRTHAPITARAMDRAHADALVAAGADYVIHEAAEAALQLAVRVLEDFGMAPESARARITRAREEIYGDPERDVSNED